MHSTFLLSNRNYTIFPEAWSQRRVFCQNGRGIPSPKFFKGDIVYRWKLSIERKTENGYIPGVKVAGSGDREVLFGDADRFWVETIKMIASDSESEKNV